MNFVKVRTVLGGPAPKTVEKFLRAQEKIAAQDLQWQHAKAELLAQFATLLEAGKRAILK